MNKAREGDGIPVELFQILKDDAVKVLNSMYQKRWDIHTVEYHSAMKRMK